MYIFSILADKFWKEFYQFLFLWCKICCSFPGILRSLTEMCTHGTFKKCTSPVSIDNWETRKALSLYSLSSDPWGSWNLEWNVSSKETTNPNQGTAGKVFFRKIFRLWDEQSKNQFRRATCGYASFTTNTVKIVQYTFIPMVLIWKPVL